MKKIIISLIFGLIGIVKISAATFTVTSSSDSGPGTFRQAILDANALPGADIIAFSIGTGTKTITLLSVVHITSEIDIDGSTQPGFSGTPLIKISGTSMFQMTNANGAKVQYLEFINNSGSTAILANSISNCLINSNVIIGAAFAIRLDGDNTNNTITNNNFSGATGYGIVLALGVNNGNSITNNNLSNCVFRGLYYGLGTPASINNNDFTGSINALFLGGATNFTITSPTGSGPNKNVFGNHTGRVLELFDNTNLNVSNWDFTSLVAVPLNIRNPLFVRNSTTNVFENCNLAGMENGIQFDDNNTNDIINNCNFSGAALYGIVFNNGNNQGNAITNNNVANCGDYGLYYSNGTPASVNSNTFTGSVGGIYLSGAVTFTLGSSNVFKNQTGTSIQLEASSAVNVSNNVVNGSGGTGILLNQSNNCVINGNTTCGRTYGIRIQGTSNGNMISNGSIVSSAFGIRLDNSAVNNTTITAVNLFNTTNISNGGSNTVITVTTSSNTSPIISVNSGIICSGQSFTMVPNGAVTYSFSGGYAVVSPTITSTYSVVGTDANGCVSAVAAISTVVVPFTPIVTVNSGVICYGQSFTMTPSSPGTVTYSYSSGSAIVTPTSNATYSVIAINNYGCVSSNTAISAVTVNPLPNITFNIGEICSGQSFTIVPTGADTYTYLNGSSIVTPSSTTSYTVTGTTALTGCTNTAISTVTVNALPTILVNSGSVCAGQSFTMVPSGADTYTYSSGSSVVTPTINTSYNIVGTSSLGCVSSNTAVSSVTVNALPIISVSSGSICAGQSYTIIANGASTYTSVPSLAGPIVTPTATTNYSITGTDTNGCVSSNTVVSSVIVNALPSISVNSGSICVGQSFTMIPSGADTYTYSNGSSVATPTANATYSISGTNTVTGCVSNVDAVSSVSVNVLPSISVNSGSICAGQSFTMVPSGAATYSYSNGSSITTPTANATYSVSGTDANGCVSNIDAVSSVTVNALPNVMVMTTNTLLCVGESATLTVMGASTYTWSTAENTTDIVVTPTVQTTYTVNGTDANGCVNSSTILQDVSLCTGLNQIVSVGNDLSVYPNPSNGIFNINVTTPSQVTILNLLGKVIYAEQLAVGVNSINLSQFANGIYLLKAESNGNSKTIRLIKE
jgi:parallel beta-helix repeat protein